MYFIHHQQAARQQGVAHVGVPNFERTEQGLVNRADGNGRGQKTFGRFGHPTLVRLLVGGMIGPLHLEVWQADLFLVVRRFIARQGTHHHGRMCRPQATHQFPHALVQLRCSNAGGQCKVQAIDLARFKQLNEAPQRRLGLAAASFGLQHHDVAQGQVGSSQLHRACLRHTEGRTESGRLAAQLTTPFVHIQANGLHRVFRTHSGSLGSILAGNGVGEKSFTGVRAQPVGQLNKAGEQMHECRLFWQGFTAFGKGQWKA